MTTETHTEKLNTLVPRIAEHGRYLEDWAAQTPAQLVNSLGDIVADALVALRPAVALYREAGASWADIGRALDISAQAAQQRFGR